MSTNEEESEELDSKEFPPLPKDGIPYDKGWAWLIVVGSFTMHALVVGFNKSFGILFVEFQSIFELTSATTSWIAAIMMTSLNLGSLVGTTLSDHFTSRRIVIIGGVLMGLALVLSSFASRIEYIYVTIGLVFGIGCSFSYGPSIVMVAYYFHDRMALANAVSVSGSGIGAFVLPPLVTALIDAYSLKGALIVIGALMLHMCIAGALFRPTSYYRHATTMTTTTAPLLSTDGVNGREKNRGDSQATREESYHTSYDEILYRCSKRQLRGRRVSLSHNDLYRQQQQQQQQPHRKQHETFIYSSYKDLVISTVNIRATDGPTVNGPTADSRVTNVPAVGTLNDSARAPAAVDAKFSCLPCRVKTKSFLSNLFDFSLFKSPVFVLLALGCTLQNFGYVGQFRFFPARMKDLGIPQMQRALLLSIMGAMDIFSRLIIGVLADFPFVRMRIKRYRILASAIFLLGLCGVLCPLAVTFQTNIIYAVSLGVCGGVNQAMMGVSVMDLLGREMVCKAWGLLLLLYGMTNIGEPIILGALRDSTGNYDWTFRTCGFSVIAGSLLIFCEHFALKRRSQLNKNKNRFCC